MTAFDIKVNESRHTCMLLINKEIYSIKQYTNPRNFLHYLVKPYLLYSFNTNLQNP